jgi:hypothetical protein
MELLRCGCCVELEPEEEAGLAGNPHLHPSLGGPLETARTQLLRALGARSHCYSCRRHLQAPSSREFPSSP